MVTIITVFLFLASVLCALWVFIDGKKIYTIKEPNNKTIKVVIKKGVFDPKDGEITVFREKSLFSFRKTEEMNGLNSVLDEDSKNLKEHKYRFDSSRGTLILDDDSVYKIR